VTRLSLSCLAADATSLGPLVPSLPTLYLGAADHSMQRLTYWDSGWFVYIRYEGTQSPWGYLYGYDTAYELMLFSDGTLEYRLCSGYNGGGVMGLSDGYSWVINPLPVGNAFVLTNLYWSGAVSLCSYCYVDNYLDYGTVSPAVAPRLGCDCSMVISA
jgi:hypothetical protein